MANCNPTPAKVQKVENEEPGSDVASGSGGGGTGVEESGIVDKKNLRELSETPKVLPKPTRRVKEREDFQRQLLSLMQQEDDDLDLTFQSMAKRIKDHLTPEQRDDLVDEMFLLVSKHIRESKKPKYPPATSTISVAPGNNLGMGDGVPTMTPTVTPVPPPMQRMPIYNETLKNTLEFDVGLFPLKIIHIVCSLYSNSVLLPGYPKLIHIICSLTELCLQQVALK